MLERINKPMLFRGKELSAIASWVNFIGIFNVCCVLVGLVLRIMFGQFCKPGTRSQGRECCIFWESDL